MEVYSTNVHVHRCVMEGKMYVNNAHTHTGSPIPLQWPKNPQNIHMYMYVRICT